MTNEAFLPPVYQEFAPEERRELRAFFEGPLWKKTLANIRTERPFLFPLGTDTVLGQQIACNRLHQRQGWEMFEVALAKTILPLPPKKKLLQETWPDSGRTDFTKPETK